MAAARRKTALPAGKLLTGLLALVVATYTPAQDHSVKPSLHPQAGQPATVGVTAARELFVYPAREALAVVLARNESRIAAQVTAVVATIDARVGQVVRRGDVLATLDDTDIRLSLAQALAARDGLQARLNLARRQLRRLRELKTNNFVSTEAVNQRDAEVVSLRAELKGAAAQVAVIERQLDKC